MVNFSFSRMGLPLALAVGLGLAALSPAAHADGARSGGMGSGNFGNGRYDRDHDSRRHGHDHVVVHGRKICDSRGRCKAQFYDSRFDRYGRPYGSATGYDSDSFSNLGRSANNPVRYTEEESTP